MGEQVALKYAIDLLELMGESGKPQKKTEQA